MNSLLFVLSVQVIFDVRAIVVQSCGNEADCLEGYSCVDNICKKCLKCDLLLRKGKLCVLDLNECGDCLEGFEEISITDLSSAVKPCKPVKKKFKSKGCTNNNSCPPNKYCSEGSCIKCFDCSLVNRLSPVGKCVKAFDECGSCIEGFHVIDVTTVTNSKPCVTKKPSILKSSFPVVLYPLSIVGFLIVIYKVIWKHHKGRMVNKSTSQTIHMTSPSAPPLWAMDAPEICRGIREVDSSFMSFERERKQQSKIFKQPDASYYWREEDETHHEARGDQVSGNNEDTLSSSLGANRSQPRGECSRETFTNEFLALHIHDSETDSSSQQPNEISTGNNDSTSVDLATFYTMDSAEVDEDSDNETSDIVPVIQRPEQREM